jgi:hypothetical protein
MKKLMAEGIYAVLTFWNIKSNLISDGIDRVMPDRRKLEINLELGTDHVEKVLVPAVNEFDESIALFIQIGLSLETLR